MVTGLLVLAGARSTTQAVVLAFSASLTRMWSMRRPRFSGNRACGSPHQEKLFSGCSNMRKASVRPRSSRLWKCARSSGCGGWCRAGLRGRKNHGLRGYVEVTHQQQLGMLGHFSLHKGMQRRQPAQLVGKLFGIRGLTVDKVAVDQAHFALWCVQCGGNHACLLIVVPGMLRTTSRTG